MITYQWAPFTSIRMVLWWLNSSPAHEWNELSEIIGRSEYIEKFLVMQKHSKPLKYSISSLFSVNYVWLSCISKGIVPPSLYCPACSSHSHSPALFHFSSSLALLSQAADFPSKPLGHDWHDLGRGFSILWGRSRLPPASSHHNHHQTTQLHVSVPHPLESCRCGGSQHILISPKQASL